MRYGMVIDTKRCIGCMACAMMCKVANNLPDGVWWNRVVTEGGAYPDTAGGSFEDPFMQYRPLACQHCQNPACVAACPTGATSKDEETGIVLQNTDECIGCGSCIEACPYGVRTLIDEDPSYQADYSFGDVDAPAHQKGVVEKCVFCAPRLACGEAPACVECCLARARTFGDLDDPDSEVSKKLAEFDAKPYLESEGTQPSVYFI